MNLKPLVMKFGGTSVEDAGAINRVSRIVYSRKDSLPIVVVSAMSKVTDALLFCAEKAAEGEVEAARSAIEEHFKRHLAVAETLLNASERASFESLIADTRANATTLLRAICDERQPFALLQDALVSTGETLSASLLAAVLREAGLPARFVDARQCIVTDDAWGRAAPLMKETEQKTRALIQPLLEASELPVMGGFIASTASGETTTLGRGGSDFTAAIVGASLHAQEIQIWTDVPGVMTADPRIVRSAHTIPRLSYAEASELAYFGAKVLHPKTILPAVERSIPVRICDSRNVDAQGTVVYFDAGRTPRTVKAIAHKMGVHILSVTSARMLGAYGFLRAIFAVFERHKTIVDVVTTSEVSVSISLDDTDALDSIVRDLHEVGEVKVERGRAIICVVGEGLRNTSGIAGRLFNTIRDINVLLISQGASSINLTFVIEEERAAEAVRRLHAAFFEHAAEETLSHAGTH
ncbi:MAG TPA: lysine-sensitive aspartokinase 3 [Pyrinomonadaceae bacterium]|nr:lysine-sensitive aspartokinase 3 [Pyrinomonadaceae bacterium]